MPLVSDLVKDSKLDTQFKGGLTVHVSYVSGASSRQRKIRKEETWRRLKQLGSGAYGTVWLENESTEQKVRAVKTIRKQADGSTPIDYSRELEAIAKFSHVKYERCFVKSFGWFENQDALFIAMEYLPLGDLQSYLHSCLPENEAQQISSQVLEGLSFMHESGFAHRDLKPENLLVVEHGPDWWIKIGDFGISKRVEDHQTAFRTFNGTMGFIAPEILGLVETEPGNEGYTVSVDIWAMGVIAFRILTGKLPIPMERLADYVRGKLNFPGDILETHHVSVEGCEFVGGLMMPHPNDRMTADKALLHAWLKKVNSPSPRNSADIQGESEAAPMSHLAGSTRPESSKPSARWSAVEPSSSPSPKQEAPKIVELAPAAKHERNHVAKLSPNEPLPNLTTPSNSLESTETPLAMVYRPAASRITKSADRMGTSKPHGMGSSKPHGMGSSKPRENDPSSAKLSNADVDGNRAFPPARSTDKPQAIEPHPLRIRWKSSPRIRDYSFSSTWIDVGEPFYYNMIGRLPVISLSLLSPRGVKSTVKGILTGMRGLAYKRSLDRLFEIHSEEIVRSLLFSPDGRLLLTATPEKLSVWDTASQVEMGKFESPGVKSPVFSPNGELLAVAEEKSIFVWDLRTGKALGVLEHESTVNSVIFSPDSKLLASISNSLSVWRSETGAKVDEVDFRPPGLQAVAFSADGQVLALMLSDSVRLYDATWERIYADQMPKIVSPTAMAFSPVAATLAVAGLYKITLWDITKKSWTSIDFLEPCHRLDFSPDGRWLAFNVGHQRLNSNFRLWDVAKKQYSGPTTLLFDMASVVAFSPDSRVLAVGLHNGQIQLWNLDVSRTPLAIMIPFHARLDMNTLAFSPDGKLLASGSWDKKIILWAAGQ